MKPTRESPGAGAGRGNRLDDLGGSLQDRFYRLLDSYSQGDEPLENWDTRDLSELESIVNAEIQDRYRKSQDDLGYTDAFDDYEQD